MLPLEYLLHLNDADPDHEMMPQLLWNQYFCLLAKIIIYEVQLDQE